MVGFYSGVDTLGGNKSYYRNILIIFLFVGLWHGAGWNFVAWGLLHACFVLGYVSIADFWDKFPPLIQRTANFLLVSLAWILFLFDFEQAYQFFISLIGGGPQTIPVPQLGKWLLVLLAGIVCFGVNFEKLIHKVDAASWKQWAYSASLGVIGVLILLMLDRSQTFIYFRF